MKKNKVIIRMLEEGMKPNIPIVAKGLNPSAGYDLEHKLIAEIGRRIL